MKMHTVAVAVAISAVPLTVSAQTIDQLVADHALLNAELDRCKQLGMTSVDDARCKTARAAENKRFFGSGTVPYTEGPVQVFQHRPHIDPQPQSQKPNRAGPPNG